jgi:hypothetical protein
VRYVSRNAVAEWSYVTGKPYGDPFADLWLDVRFTDPNGLERTVPAFWAGGQKWCVRYASPQAGLHRHVTVCSDQGNADLHGVEGTLEVTPSAGRTRLQQHGRLQRAAGRRYLEHEDGTPFFWLGDTWWMALCRRLDWPAGFCALTADRVAKGFTVAQIVAGLYPDMPPFDERGANEAGHPWEEGYQRVNPSYFDMADLRLAHLLHAGIVPCIVGSWGFYMDFAGPDVLRKHWRYLIARYGAYPVIWCAAGEALMHYYLGREQVEDEEARLARLRAAWAELIRYIRATDAFSNPVTVHPTRYGHDQVDDPALLDLDMLQTGHSGHPTLSRTVDMLNESTAREPVLPVLVAEANYEGIIESSREEMQRFLFWSCMLLGAAGHTYGANGLWQVNGRGEPYGPSPHGTSWGDLPWEEAYQLPGSAQLGFAKRLLERYAWWRFEPHPEWVVPHQTPENRMSVYAAGVPGVVRICYVPAEVCWVVHRGELTVSELEPGVRYRAAYFDPKRGVEHELGAITGDEAGCWAPPKPPIFQDWVLLLDNTEAGNRQT